MVKLLFSNVFVFDFVCLRAAKNLFFLIYRLLEGKRQSCRRRYKKDLKYNFKKDHRGLRTNLFQEENKTIEKKKQLGTMNKLKRTNKKLENMKIGKIEEKNNKRRRG